MSHAPDRQHTPGIPREPAWDVARLFPDQGCWSEDDYFALSAGNRLVEYSHGEVEILSMPTFSHQLIVVFLFDAIRTFLGAGRLGTAMIAPLPVRLWEAKYHEPDVVVMLREHADRMGERCWEGADLVVEVVSDDDRRRDTETKRREYAQAGIPEYWIIDPRDGRITVLALEPGASSYAVHGTYGRGERAPSRLLPGFEVDVAAALDVKP